MDAELAQEPVEFAEGPLDLLLREEQHADFMNHLNQLPPDHRSVLLLYFVEDFSLGEISRITGTGLGTVKSRMHYAKKGLRRIFEEARQ